MTTTEKVGESTMERPAPGQITSTDNGVSWLERTLKPKTYKPRYPFVGKPLLWMTCAFGSLGDALFGYDQGMTVLVPKTAMSINIVTRYHGWPPGEPRLCEALLL